MRPARGLVFDLDGTIADTRDDLVEACNHALAGVGRAPLAAGTVVGFVGDGSRMLVARALALPEGDPLVAEAFALFTAYYTEHAADTARFMPGARETLDACAHLPLALATNKPRAATVALLDALGVARLFRVVVAGGDGPLKPAPAAIHSALAGLGVGASEAWVVGDGPQDVGAGRAAGTWTVGVLGGFASERTLRAAGPDRVLAGIAELPRLLAAIATTP